MKDISTEDVGTRRSMGPTRSWKTSPLTNTFHESPKSSLLFAAQSRAFTNKQLQNQPSTLSFVKTPSFCRTNPFEDISSLEYDKCSPGLFILQQSNEENGEFKWSIEDISRIMPAQIETPKSVLEENFDEETENAAQEAIEKYFSLRHSVVSPRSTCGEALPSPETTSTPPAELLMVRAAMACRSSISLKGYSSGSKGMISAISSTPCARSERRLVIKVDGCSQTQLSLPPILPPEVESVLRPYMSNKDDKWETEECNISSMTLRRKLFFNKDDYALSAVECEKNGHSPNGSPMQDNTRPSRIDWTPDEKKEGQLYCLSSPDISPIKCKASFEFPKDMSIDYSSISQNNPCDNGTSEQPLVKPTASVKFSASTESETYPQGRGIFSSTVQSSHIDRTDKDTGYSTMDIDCTPSAQAQLINKMY